MGGQPAVCVRHQLPARQAGVRLKASQHKPPGGVDEHLRFRIGVQVPQGGDDDVPDDLPAQLVHILVRIVLAGDHHGGDSVGSASLVLHGHLGLSVRPQAPDDPRPAGVGEQQRQPVGHHHGQGQELGGLRTGEAVHDALVAGAHLGITAHSAGDIVALVVGDGLHLIVAASVARLPHSPADDGGDVRQVPGGDLPGHDDLPGSGHDLAGHTGGGVAAQAGVQDAVRDGVAQLVRVALGDRLGGQDVFISHSEFPSFLQILCPDGRGAVPGTGAGRSPGTGCPGWTLPGCHGECRTVRRWGTALP